jgi:hypothetical protein
MHIKSLQQFLYDSNQAGYAGGQEKQWVKEKDGSTTIPFAMGDWRSHDNFFGGEPYGGRIIVFHKNNPVWMMVYYGQVAEGVEPNTVYEVLRSALIKMPKEAPFRGPSRHQEKGFIYQNTWQGDVERYSGEEKITHNGQVIYQASYMGGLVDQRRGG